MEGLSISSRKTSPSNPKRHKQGAASLSSFLHDTMIVWYILFKAIHYNFNSVFNIPTLVGKIKDTIPPVGQIVSIFILFELSTHDPIGSLEGDFTFKVG